MDGKLATKEGAKEMAINRKKAEDLIKQFQYVIKILLEDLDMTTEERLYARVAYLNLNALRNSLHRFLVDKSKNTVTFHKVSKHRKT